MNDEKEGTANARRPRILNFLCAIDVKSNRANAQQLTLAAKLISALKEMVFHFVHSMLETFIREELTEKLENVFLLESIQCGSCPCAWIRHNGMNRTGDVSYHNITYTSTHTHAPTHTHARIHHIQETFDIKCARWATMPHTPSITSFILSALVPTENDSTQFHHISNGI